MNSINAAPPKNAVRIVRQILPALLLLPLLLPSVALILSGIMSWANVGFGEQFLHRWAVGFLTSLVVLPMILMCLDTLERLVDRVLGDSHWVARKLVVALLTSCLIESVLALAVTVINAPDDVTFAQSWWVAFSRSMPAGVVISLFMCFYMKPRLDRMRQAGRVAPAT